jgi:hypothetical protein
VNQPTRSTRNIREFPYRIAVSRRPIGFLKVMRAKIRTKSTASSRVRAICELLGNGSSTKAQRDGTTLDREGSQNSNRNTRDASLLRASNLAGHDRANVARSRTLSDYSSTTTYVPRDVSAINDRLFFALAPAGTIANIPGHW